MADFDNTAASPASIDVAAWASVRVALTSGVTDPLTIANGSVVDGVTLATSNRFVCVGTRADAGIYVVGASASTRATDANEAGEFVAPRLVRVTSGTYDNVGQWVHKTSGAITLGTTPLTFSKNIAFSEDLPGSTFSNTASDGVTIPNTTFSNDVPDGEVLTGSVPTDSILCEHGGPLCDEDLKPLLLE